MNATTIETDSHKYAAARTELADTIASVSQGVRSPHAVARIVLRAVAHMYANEQSELTSRLLDLAAAHYVDEAKKAGQ